jgi:hypothetical protein
MERLAIHLALHGAIVLTISILCGLFLYLAILNKKQVSAWHLVHSGGTARGIMLIALAAIISYPVLPIWQLTTLVWLFIFFVWTSMIAMIIAALSGARGLGYEGSSANKLVYLLYASGTIAVFPACSLLIYGLFKAITTSM